MCTFASILIAPVYLHSGSLATKTLYVMVLVHFLVKLHRLVFVDSADKLVCKVFSSTSTATFQAAGLSCPEVTHNLQRTMTILATAC